MDASDCVCLSGPSGAGKTLLLRAIADLDEHRGSVLLDGVDAAQVAAPRWRRQVALLPAESHWWSDRVGDHFGDASVWLERLGFDSSVLDWSVGNCSTGERQRLALARLLQNRPAVLLLDEPTASLDTENVARVEALIADYRAETDAAVVWVSHDPAQIARLCRRTLLLNNGVLHESEAHP